MASAQEPIGAKMSEFRILVLKGGGVKGIALAGAYIELEPYCRFDTFVGTSGGAIVATFLAAGMTGADLDHTLDETAFPTLLSANVFESIWLLVTRGGLHGGQRLQEWINSRLKAALSRNSPPSLFDLPARCIAFATAPGRGVVTFDSHGANGKVEAAFAARCSAAIPVFFVRPDHEGRPISDGGLMANFPVDEFRKIWQNENQSDSTAPILAIYLGRPSASVPSGATHILAVLRDMFRIWLERNEAIVIDEELVGRVIVVDTDPVRTTDFSLTETAKSLLRNRGRVAALRFLSKEDRLLDTRNVILSKLDQAQGELDRDEIAIKREVTRRRLRRRGVFATAAIVGVAALTMQETVRSRVNQLVRSFGASTPSVVDSAELLRLPRISISTTNETTDELKIQGRVAEYLQGTFAEHASLEFANKNTTPDSLQTIVSLRVSQDDSKKQVVIVYQLRKPATPVSLPLSGVLSYPTESDSVALRQNIGALTALAIAMNCYDSEKFDCSARRFRQVLIDTAFTQRLDIRPARYALTHFFWYSAQEANSDEKALQMVSDDSIAPFYPELLEKRAQLMFRSGFGALALPVADSAILSFLTLDSRLTRARINTALGRHSEALVDLDAAVAGWPKSAMAYRTRGAFLLEFGDRATGEADLDNAYRLDKSCIACVYNDLGNSLSDRGKYQEALRFYNKAIREDTTAGWGNEGQYKARLNRAYAYERTGSPRQADADLSAVRSQLTDSANFYYTLGRINLRRKKFTATIAVLDTLARFDKTPRAEWLIASLWYEVLTAAPNSREGLDSVTAFDRLEEATTRAVKLYPQNAQALSQRGFALTFAGHPEEAIKVHSRIISERLSASDVSARVNRSHNYLLLREFSKALQDAEYATKVAPNDPAALANRGLASLGLGDTVSALVWLNRAASHSKEREFLDSISVVYSRAGPRADVLRKLARSKEQDLRREESNTRDQLRLEHVQDISGTWRSLASLYVYRIRPLGSDSIEVVAERHPSPRGMVLTLGARTDLGKWSVRRLLTSKVPPCEQWSSVRGSVTISSDGDTLRWSVPEMKFDPGGCNQRLIGNTTFVWRRELSN